MTLFKTPTCNHINPEYLRNISTVLKDNRFSFDSYLIRPLHADVHIDLELYTRKHNSKNYQTIYQCSIGLCRVLNSPKINLMKKWMNTLIKHGNFRTKCPIYESRYFIKNMSTLLLEVPSFLFNGFYRFTVDMSQPKNNGKDLEFLIECIFDIEVKST